MRIKINIKNNKKIVFTTTILLVIIMLILVYLSIDSLSLFNPTSRITPRPAEEVRQEIDAYLNQEGEEEREYPLGGELSLLHDSTPHYGKNFTLTYNDDNRYFYYYINPENQAAGEKEFNDFLRKHGIADKSLIDWLNKSNEPL